MDVPVYFYYTCSPVGVTYTSINFDLSRSVVATLNYMYCGTHLQILDVHRKTLSHRLSLNVPSNTTIVNFKVPSPTLEHLYMHKRHHWPNIHVTTPAPSLPPPNHPHPSHPPMPHLNFSSTDQFWQPSHHAATSTY